MQYGTFFKIKYTKIFTPESFIYQSLYRKIIFIAVIVSKNNFFGTKLLHANVQCVYIAKAKYHIAPSKAVVVVDRLMKALSIHIQSNTMENCLSSHFVKKQFFNQTPSCICLMCLHCIGQVSNCSIKSCGRS